MHLHSNDTLSIHCAESKSGHAQLAGRLAATPRIRQLTRFGLGLVLLLVATVCLSQPGHPLSLAAVTVKPTSLGFGNQDVGLQGSGKTVTLTNNQTKTLTILDIATNLSDYTTTTTCPMSPSTLAAGASCNISVFFKPSVTGTRDGTLTVTNNTSIIPKVSLSGTGVVPPSVSPTSLVFAQQIVGTTSASQQATLTNNLPTPLTISSISSSLSDFAVSSACPISPGTLAAGHSCTVTVTFTPKSSGSRSGVLRFRDNAENSPQSVSLIGTGVTATLQSMSVTPQPASVALGNTLQFTATGTYNNGTTKNLTSSVKWTSSAPSVAKISGGLATSVSQGTTNITATIGTIVGSSTLTVTAPALVSLAVTPQGASIPAGTTQQFAATGTFTNGTQQNLTNSVTWGSSNAAVATVNTSGLATALAAGTTTISAAYGSISGNTTLNVTPSESVYSRIPRRVCLAENETSTSSSCTLAATIPTGDGVLVFVSSVNAETLSPNPLQDTKGNAYTLLAGPVSGGYGSLYAGFSRLTTALNGGDVITWSVPGADSWGLSIYDLGPVENDPADVGVTFQNPDGNDGLPGFNNSATGLPGWWTGQTTPTTGSSDVCMAALGVGSPNNGDGTPSPITVFTADNGFKELDVTQTYSQSDPNYGSGGTILAMYTEVPAGTAVQSHVITYDSIPNTAPAVLQCFKEGVGPVQNVPWFTGNYCSGTASCTIDNVVPGHMLVIGSHSYIKLPYTPITITDSQPETVTFDQLDGSVGLGSWHISPVVNGGSHTITVVDPVDSSLGMLVAEIAGQASGNPVEAVAQNSIIDSTLASVNITTQTPNDLLFGWGRSYFGSDEGQGFTAIQVMPTAEYAVAPAVGLQTVSILPRGTPPWTETGIQALAIRPAGSPQPPVLAPSFTGNYCIGYIANTCTINNVSAGDLLVISSLAGGSLSQPPQVTDSLGEIIVVDRGNDSDGSITLSTWHIAAVANAGTHTITLDNAVVMVVTEYSSQSQTNPIDAVTAATGTTGGFASAAVQTSQGNDLIYAWCATDSPSGWGDGFAAFWTSPTSEFRMAASTPGTETATCPSSPNDPTSPWVIQELAIRH